MKFEHLIGQAKLNNHRIKLFTVSVALGVKLTILVIKKAIQQ